MIQERPCQVSGGTAEPPDTGTALCRCGCPFCTERRIVIARAAEVAWGTGQARKAPTPPRPPTSSTLPVTQWRGWGSFRAKKNLPPVDAVSRPAANRRQLVVNRQQWTINRRRSAVHPRVHKVPGGGGPERAKCKRSASRGPPCPRRFGSAWSRPRRLPTPLAPEHRFDGEAGRCLTLQNVCPFTWGVNTLYHQTVGPVAGASYCPPPPPKRSRAINRAAAGRRS